jgi:hypothetical protein
LPAISPADQRVPTKQAVLAFLRSYLDEDEAIRAAHCAFLERRLGHRPGITVE